MYGMGEKYIFDIAVYSVTGEKFFTKREKKIQEHFDWLNKMSLATLPKRSPTSNNEFDRDVKDRFIRKYGGWQFTQVVGWIRLFPLVRQMRGEYWFVNSKRIDIHMNKKKFECYYKAFESSNFTGNESSTEIYHEIIKEIAKLKREAQFKDRYIDLEPFQNIGLFVNWRELIGLD